MNTVAGLASPSVSVVICTFNRCEQLRVTLNTFLSLKIPPSVSWELLVVDNNSNDNTQQTCAALKHSLPLRYVFEGRPGKSNALNRAIAETSAELILFTDDDVDVAPDWLINHC